MRHEIPLLSVHGSALPTPLVLEERGDTVRLLIDGAYLGRDVDEELARSALAELLAGGPRRNHDLLGLTLETEGCETIRLTVGVGSGNERLVVQRDDLARALGL